MNYTLVLAPDLQLDAAAFVAAWNTDPHAQRIASATPAPEAKGLAEAGVYQQLGRVAEEQRQWTQAEQYYQQALALKIEFNDRHAQAVTYHQLGIVAYWQRQWDQAEQHYQQALALYIEFNDRYSQASAYHNLGIVAQEQQQWAQARDYLLQALTISVKFNIDGVGITLGSIARLWQANGLTDLPAAVATIFNVTPKKMEDAFTERLADDSAPLV